MTDYIAITDTQVDPDAPLTSQLGYQFRNNPIAIAEGSVGAPVVALQALGRFTAGIVRRYYDTTQYDTTSSAQTTVFAGSFAGSGVVRIKYDYKNTTAGNTSRILVDGVQQAVFVATTSFVTQSVDLTLALGNYVQIQHISNGTATSSIKNIEFLTNGEQLLPYPSLNNWVLT